MSAAGGFVAFIIIIIIIGVFWYSYSSQHEMMKKGCTAMAWNQYGLATEMSCPADIEVEPGYIK